MGKHTTANHSKANSQAAIITRIVPIDAERQTALDFDALGPAQARLARRSIAAQAPEPTVPDPPTAKTATKTTKTATKTTKTATKTNARSSRSVAKVMPVETLAIPQEVVADPAPDRARDSAVHRLQNLEEAIDRLNHQSQHVRHTLEELQKLSDALPQRPRTLEMPDFSRSRLATWAVEPEAVAAVDPQLTLQEAQARYQATVSEPPIARPSQLPLVPPPLARPSQPQRPTQRLAAAHSNPRPQRRRPIQRKKSIAAIGGRCFKSLRQLWQQRLPIPHSSGAKAIDGMLWLGGAIGVRIVMGMVVSALPILGWVLPGMLLVPGIYASYLAFCEPDSRTDLVYRLCLLTLGFFLGSKV